MRDPEKRENGSRSASLPVGCIFLNLSPKNSMRNLFLNSDEGFVGNPRKPSKTGNVSRDPEMNIKGKTSFTPKGVEGR